MCLRVSLVPIYYHTLTVYGLPRETVIQGPLDVGDCYLGIIRIQTTSTGLSPAESITWPPRLYFCCMLTTAIVRHTPTLPLPHTQLNQYQYRLDLLSGLVLSPLRTTSHIVLEDILLSLHSHAIDNEHSTSSMDLQSFWLPSTTTSDVKISSFNEWTSFHITTLYARFA